MATGVVQSAKNVPCSLTFSIHKTVHVFIHVKLRRKVTEILYKGKNSGQQLPHGVRALGL